VKRCVAYCRVSTSKDDQLNSLENQKSYFEREIERTKDCTMLEIYADEGLTGTKLNNRPEFNRLLRDAGIDVIETYSNKLDKRLKKKHVLYEVSDREPMFDEIWIKNTSRFARNTLSFEIILKLREQGINIKFIEQNLNTKDYSGDFFLKLFQAFDEQDSRDKSIKVRTGIKEGAMKGVIYTNTRIFGYKYIPIENMLEILPDEAEIVRMIFELYGSGEGIRRIINYLTEQGHLTREGKPFGKTTIRRILTNEKYAGINVRMKYDTGVVFSKNSYAKVKPKDEWVISSTQKIPAIVTVELFYKCQSLLESRVNHQNQIGVYKGITKYAGLLYCGVCGNSYISNVDRGRRFYNCSNKKAKGINACNGKNISAKVLEELLWPEFYSIVKGGAIHAARYSLEKSKEEHTERLTQTLVVRIEELETKVLSVSNKAQRLLDVYLDNIISKEEYEHKKRTLDAEKKVLEDELKSLTMPRNEIIEAKAEIDKAIAKINSIEHKMDYTEDEMLESIDKITIMPDNTIEVKFNFNIDETKVKVNDLTFTIKYKD
jgi:site-specific DNA recombinase